MNLFDITLREATTDDAALIFEAIDKHRDDLRVWLSFVDTLKTAEDERRFLESIYQEPEETRNPTYLIFYREEFAGLVGYVSSDHTNHRTEIGYWLLPEFRGKGIMTHCVRKLCRTAVEGLNMHRIQIRCATGNTPSNAIPIRLGFQLEGTERDGELLADNRYTDLNVYSILKDEVDGWLPIIGNTRITNLLN